MAVYQKWTDLEHTFAIDGTWIPELITAWSLGDDDLSDDDSGRTLDGVMHKNVVDGKEYYDFSLSKISWETYARLSALLRKKKKIAFTYPNPHDPAHIGYLTTKDFYVQAREGSDTRLFMKDGVPTLEAKSLKFKLAEI